MGDTIATRESQLDRWLFETVLPHWYATAMDPQTGLSVECLDFEGDAMPEVKRRGRVAPRQLFTFARAYRLGFDAPDAFLSMLAGGAETLRKKSFCPERGFPSEIGPDGEGRAFDEMLYDHAFIALAGAELEAIGVNGGAELADMAFSRIEARFRDADHGGFLTHPACEEGKLSNPHMHLLEASLLHHAVTGSEESLQRVREISGLCIDRFIGSPAGLISEQVSADLTEAESDWTEPGHCFEWAYLLHQASLTLDDAGLTQKAKALFERSEALVEEDGLVPDRIGANPLTYRLWPQLERLRCLVTFEKTDAVAPLVETLNRVYLDKGPEPGWVDKVDASRQPLSENVPASMLYHLMTAIPVVTRPEKTF